MAQRHNQQEGQKSAESRQHILRRILGTGAHILSQQEGDVSGLKRSTNGADPQIMEGKCLSRRQVEICLTSHMFLSWGRGKGKGKVYARALSDSISFALPGDKRFECGQCQKRFMRSDHLTKHYKTHMVTKNL